MYLYIYIYLFTYLFLYLFIYLFAYLFDCLLLNYCISAYIILIAADQRSFR